LSLIKFSQIKRDVNWPTVWRYEYSNSAAGPTAVTTITTPKIIWTYSLVLTETSHVRYAFAAQINPTSAAYTVGGIKFDRDGVGLTAQGTALVHTTNFATGTAATFYTDLNLVAGTYAITFVSTTSGGDIFLYNYNASIDVCRV
jgi:hypothetical protein